MKHIGMNQFDFSLLYNPQAVTPTGSLVFFAVLGGNFKIASTRCPALSKIIRKNLYTTGQNLNATALYQPSKSTNVLVEVCYIVRYTTIRCVCVFYLEFQSAQKCHMHINSTRHFFRITPISILNFISKYSPIT